MKNFVQDWLYANALDPEGEEYADCSYAVDQLFFWAHENPGKLIKAADGILRASDDEFVRNALGAGPLEDAFVHHGVDFVSLLKKAIANGSIVDRCLPAVFLDSCEVNGEVIDFIDGYRSKSTIID